MKQIDIDTIAADIETCRRYIRNHQHLTIECVAFEPTGKVEVVDKDRLEELNAEVCRLTDLAEHNEKVLFQLEETLGAFSTIAALKERRSYTNESIDKVRNLLRHDVGERLKRDPSIDPGDPFSNAECKRLQNEANNRLAVLVPELAALDEQLARSQSIMQEFKPSDLEPLPASTAPAIISREKVSGFGV